MDSVLVEEFGKSGKDLFRSIEEEPIGSASLAQVANSALAIMSKFLFNIILWCCTK